MQNSEDARLPRTVRLRGHDSFGRVFRQGEGVRRGEVVVKYLVQPADSAGVSVGFVTKRNTGTAVRRNRLRRLLREAYRVRRSQFETRLPEGMMVEIVLLWSGTPQQALRPSLKMIGDDLSSALGAILSRIRKRADASEKRQQ